MKRYTVKYQIATYSGEITVTCDPHADNEEIIAKAKSQLRRQAGGSLPYGYQSFKIVDEEYYD